MSYKDWSPAATAKSSFKIWLIFCVLWSVYNMAEMHNGIMSAKISVSSVNCNSLNSSVASKNNRNLKVHGITKLGTDIIFLGDTRLCNKQLVSSENKLTKLFQLNMYDGYDCFFNSKKNKRGVGILINKKISYAVEDREDDTEDNFILLKISLAGDKVILGSVYGPNVTDLSFFEKLARGIKK